MSLSKEERRARREELIARADAHRDEIARCISVWKDPLQRVDRGVEVLRKVKRGAPWIAAGMAAVGAVRAKIHGLRETIEILRPDGWLGRAQTLLRSGRALIDTVSEVRRRR